MDKEARIGAMMQAREWTLAVAESCTGGLVGHRITSVPGSSEYFLGGIIAYSNAAKQSLLGVDETVLESCGAVSQDVVSQMALGVRRRFGSNVGVGISGVAGPGGGTDEKPVGTVFIAATAGDDVLVRRFCFLGNRQDVTGQAAEAALDMILTLEGDDDGERA